jgi:hemerythrin-like domain-containing protein
MTIISDLMADLNHECDHHFTDAEIAVARGDWDAASEYFELFRDAMDKHFDAEETILFPAFEEEGGAEVGQTQVFAREHVRMRELFRQLAAAIDRRDAAEYINLSEALFTLLLQHNAHGDQVLYPLLDEILSERSEALVTEITELTEED